MKILCEVSLNVNQFDKSHFRWLNRKENYLFAFENERRLRVFAVRPDAGSAREIQSASLAETRTCSGLAWNRDESLLALVVDRKQIYLWDVKRNQFSHFKTRTGGGAGIQTLASAGGNNGASISAANRKAAKTRDIALIAWSRVSDKLAVCYATGQILLCRVVAAAAKQDNADDSEQAPAAADKSRPQQQQQQRTFTTAWERFIDNSESLLKRVAAIEVSEHSELFVCFSVISEVLIMSFDGQTKFYCQGERSNLFNAKFSPPSREYCPRSGKYMGQSLHLACQSDSDRGVFLKKISLDMDHELQEGSPKLFVLREHSPPSSDLHSNNPQQHQRKVRLINFFWLSARHMLLCLESGSIQIMQMVENPIKHDETTSIVTTPLFKINAQNGFSLGSGFMSPTSPNSTRPPSRNNNSNNKQKQLSDDLSAAASRRSSIVNTLSQASSINSGVKFITNEWPDTFKMFELIALPRKLDYAQCFALVALTDFKIFYYELYESGGGGGGGGGDGSSMMDEKFTFEHFDEIDLSDSLRRVDLKLERASWSQDCSMLALQVTSGHLLIYKTRSQSSMVASHGPRTAYLSAPSEVTILNYGLAPLHDGSSAGHAGESVSPSDRPESGGLQTPDALGRQVDNAIILSVQLKPSLLAIGPHHLALALNNRVRLYAIQNTSHDATTTTVNSSINQQLAAFHEEEYITIVLGISLSSRFAAVLFDDGRLKLHPIKSAAMIQANNTEPCEDVRKLSGDDDNDLLDERFFPDPSRPESISAFTLTEELLVYSTKERQIYVFSLNNWQIIQVCDHTSISDSPVCQLKPNERGNKFVCLVDKQLSRVRKQNNVFLYDLYSNKVFPMLNNNNNNNNNINININNPTMDNLWMKLVLNQIDATLEILTHNQSQLRNVVRESGLLSRKLDKLDSISDAIWDTDGRTLLLIESKLYHVFAILNHTLKQEEPIAEYAASAKKPVSYTTLYISQGVVSYQTGSGRVINSILETHDDELKLTRLENQIHAIKLKMRPNVIGQMDSCFASNGNSSSDSDHDGDRTAESSNDDNLVDNSSKHTDEQAQSRVRHPNSLLDVRAHLMITMLKLEYLNSILPIYPLPKCRDICKHLMEEESFNLSAQDLSEAMPKNEFHIINQLLPKLLATWSLYTLNLNFATLVYKQNNIQIYAVLMKNLINDINSKRSDSRVGVNKRILSILGCDDSDTNL